MIKTTSAFLHAVAVVTAVTASSASFAQNAEALREAAQNPIADMISVPFQYNANFNIGDTRNTQSVINFQPVFPVHLNENWNLIVRPILPTINQPPFLTGDALQQLTKFGGAEFGHSVLGFGDLTPEFFFSPTKPIMLAPDVSLVWGVGPIFQLPTATSKVLGTGKYSAGPALVTFLSITPLHITTGFLVFNLWDFAGDQDRAKVNAMTLQPFFNYNLAEGWYLTTSPVITANWEAKSDNRWTVPVGGGIGRIFKIGEQPVNVNLAAYYNVLTPRDTGADWQLRGQFTLLFPAR